MSGQKSKSKGRYEQKKVKQKLHEHYPHLDDGDIDWASMGAGGEDIILSPRAEEDIPFSIEVKYGKRPPWKKGFEQAKENAGEGRIPLYLRRKPHGERIAVLRFEDLMRLKEVWSSENESKISELKQIVKEL